MKQLLHVSYKIPKHYMELAGDSYQVSPKCLHEVVKYIKNYSMTYYGINVDVDVTKIKYNQSEYRTFSGPHNDDDDYDDDYAHYAHYIWEDEPNYTKDAMLGIIIQNMGLLKGPTELMLQTSKSKFSTEDSRNIAQIYKDMVTKDMVTKKYSKMDIFKSFISSAKNHTKLLFGKK